jgi:hypothetical protein
MTATERQRTGAVAVIWPGSNVSRRLWEAINRHGHMAVAVMPPDPERHGLFSPPDPDGWDEVITAPDDPDVVADLLAGASGVLGDEGSLPLADEVASRLGLPGNDPATSEQRRDKALMTRALVGAGLSHPRTVAAGNLDDALVAAAGIGWPVVVKPPRSCAGDGFAVCYSPADLAAAWQQAHGRENILGEVNGTLLVQERLLTTVYSVNTVSLRGEHWVIEVWKDAKANGGAGYERSDLLFPESPLYGTVTAYARNVLTALGVTWGPGLTEICLDAVGRPCAIDVAARLGGWNPPHTVSREAIGLSQAEAAVLAVSDPEALARRPPDYPGSATTVTVLFMVAPDDGVILDPGVLAETARIPGVRGFMDAQPGPADDRLGGRAVPRTTNQATNPGAWLLAGPAEMVESAAAQIRAAEPRLYRPGHPWLPDGTPPAAGNALVGSSLAGMSGRGLSGGTRPSSPGRG